MLKERTEAEREEYYVWQPGDIVLDPPPDEPEDAQESSEVAEAPTTASEPAEG